MEHDGSHETAGRRPIAVRRLGIFHRLASSLTAMGIAPNTISVAGLFFAGGAGLCLVISSGANWIDRILYVAAAVLIQLRLLANLLDGMVAIEGGRKSAKGEFFNEVPDRVSDALVLACAGYTIGASVVLGWVAALAAVFVAYLRVFGCSVGLPGDFRGPMAKQQRMFLVTLACVIMAVLPIEWWPRLPTANDASIRGPMWMTLLLIIGGCVVTAIRRLARLLGGSNQEAVRD